MNRNRGQDQGEAFLRAVTDEFRELRISHSLEPRTCVQCTARRGVLEVSTVLYDVEGYDEPRVVVRQVDEFPNSRASSWEAFLYAHTHKVCRMGESWRAGKRGPTE